MKTYSDEQLVTNYLNPVRGPHHRCGSCLRRLASNGVKGDEKALEILIKRYLKSIYSFVYRFIGNTQEVEDITQEVFLKVWRNLKKPALHRIYSGAGFDPKKGSFKSWIFTIAKNTCFDWQKKKRTIPFSVLDNKDEGLSFAETIKDPAPLASELLEKKDIARTLNKALGGLSPKYRLVLFLRYNDHFTFREIAEVLGEPLNTIKSRHRRALIMLKKLLQKAII